MQFTIKDKLSKCDGCVNAHILKNHVSNTRVTFCRSLGFAVSHISECSRWTPEIYGPIPLHVAMGALEIDPDRKRDGAGFIKTKKIDIGTLDDLDRLIEESNKKV